MANRKLPICRACTARVADVPISKEQMEVLCRQCKCIKKMESPGMPIFPVYELETLAKLTESGQPFVGRSGLIAYGI